MAFSWRLDPIVLPSRTVGSSGAAPGGGTSSAGAGAAGPGIKEDIDPKFRERYEKWKAEFLSTPAGRNDWERFANDPNFTLTIRMSEAEEKAIPPGSRDSWRQSARVDVDAYDWDGQNKLAAATILLGSRLDRDAPQDSNAYPITSSLGSPGGDRTKPAVVGKGEIIAATKLAHEVGHVKHTASPDPVEVARYQKQQDLVPEYSRNGRGMYELERLEREAKDSAEKADVQAHIAERRKLLADMAIEVGGTPDELRVERDHRAEANTIPYLQDRLGGKMPSQVKDAIAEFQRRHPGW